MRVLLQSAFYAVCLAGVTGVVDSYISVRIMTWSPGHQPHQPNAKRLQAKIYFSRAT